MSTLEQTGSQAGGIKERNLHKYTSSLEKRNKSLSGVQLDEIIFNLRTTLY